METDGFIDPTINPEKANATINRIMSSSTEDVLVEPPPESVLTLPGGLVTAEGKVVKDVEVCELNGAHEERIAKAKQSGNLARFISVLLECGVVSVGGEKPTQKMLKQMFVGDRDFIIMGIREATYGDEVELGSLECPHCGEETEFSVTLDEVPIRKLEDPLMDSVFTVNLRKGRKANIRLATGDDQEELLANMNFSPAEQNSLLLSRTVISITDSNGQERPVAGFPSLVREGLSVPDRAKLVKEVKLRQPGPRFDEVSCLHETCGKKVMLPIGIGELFQDF